FLEMLLKRNGTPLTPDRINYALSSVHTMHFEERNSNKKNVIRSALSEDAICIFKTLGISLDGLKSFQTTNCCV
ncbi:hypothetical protein DB42_EC00360, partial [Neochlamydia sp. EPS4]|uniref:hypothetical protein n=1 Tax=Neochlamydia sp. EPS4 TaxID=1478175 RepID=UPI0005831CBD